MTGTSSTLPRPNSRRFSASSPVGAPPVQRKTAPCRIRSIPSVVMKEGTPRRVVTTPLTRPTRTPRPARISRIHHVREASPSLRRAATTTTTVTSEPSDRSNSPETSTKGGPAARNATSPHQRAQRQVELARDEHEGRPGGEYHQRRGASQEGQEEGRAEEERGDQRRAEQQHREHHEDRSYGEQRPDHPLAATRGRHGPLGRGAHALPRRRGA